MKLEHIVYFFMPDSHILYIHSARFYVISVCSIIKAPEVPLKNNVLLNDIAFINLFDFYINIF